MGLLDNVKKFFGSPVETLNELGLLQGKLGEILDKWKGIKAEFEALFEPQDVDAKGNWRVVTVSDAQQVLEDLRINSLKDRATTIYQDILDLINLTIHPVGGSAETDQAILAGSAAYAGKPGAGAGAFTAASLINTVLNFADHVLEIEDKILELVQLLDVIEDMRNQIADAALSQSNPQVGIDGFSRQRQGSLHGKTGS